MSDFDPEKVHREWLDFPDAAGKWFEMDCVSAEDYDALLALYKEQAALSDAKIREAVEKATVAVAESMQTMFAEMIQNQQEK